MTLQSVSLSYSINNESELKIPLTGQLTYTPAEGDTEVDILKGLLNQIFDSGNDEKSLLNTSFYIGSYNQDKNAFVGFKYGQYNDLFNRLSAVVSRHHLPTDKGYWGETELIFSADNSADTDYFDVLSDYVGVKDIDLDFAGFRRCELESDTIIFKSKHIVEIIHPDLNTSYLSIV